MGSGATRAFWRGHGSRSGRRAGTKVGARSGASQQSRLATLKMKARRVEARRVASGEV
jgi:hypothetical protein